MKKYIIIGILLNLSFIYAQQVGKVINVSIPAPSLANNIIGEPLTQPIAVYLPPSYNNDTFKKYPVVYFLPGYDDSIAAYTNGYIYTFGSSMNSNVTQGRLKEIIMVIVNGYNMLAGCFLIIRQ